MIRVAAIAFSVVALPASAANAVAVTGQLYSAGLGAGGVALAASAGQTDAIYAITAGDLSGVSVGQQAVTYFIGSYFAENAGSRWISYASNGGTVTCFFDPRLFLTSFDRTNKEQVCLRTRHFASGCILTPSKKRLRFAPPAVGGLSITCALSSVRHGADRMASPQPTR